ncbi:uncharacterized protein LOC142242512 isoform X1 [Haematobia irritans]|uniref:uncharacterized protein LOC142242512 isoform X1 n=1 Tax=Haematobia irritans TaxID=7368 RepID=UPI003F4FE192
MSNNLNQEENDANIGLEDNNNATNGTITNQRDMQMQTSGVQPIDERYNNDSGRLNNSNSDIHYNVSRRLQRRRNRNRRKIIKNLKFIQKSIKKSLTILRKIKSQC